jgi:hypothetical protein
MAYYTNSMDDDDSTPTLTADGLEAMIEASLRDVAAGRTRPMNEFIAELKADFRSAYPEIVEMFQPPQAKQHTHN